MRKCYIYSCSKNAIPNVWYCVEHAIETMKWHFNVDIFEREHRGNELKRLITKYLEDHPEEALEF